MEGYVVRTRDGRRFVDFKSEILFSLSRLIDRYNPEVVDSASTGAGRAVKRSGSITVIGEAQRAGRRPREI